MATEYQILEDVPAYASDIADLADWSQNYGSPTPFQLFLDLIGWSDENIGAPMFDLCQAPTNLGYLELGKLADALTQYASMPRDCMDWIETLMNADEPIETDEE